MNTVEYQPVIIHSPAKVTFYLDVVQPFINNRWGVQTVILPINLFDVLSIKLVPQREIQIECDSVEVATGDSSPCYKSAKIALDAAHWFSGGVSISINKQIPVSSGLGGGSSNSTAVLCVLNSLLNIGWDIRTLLDLAFSISNDSFFFCCSKPAYVSGSANILTPLLFSPFGLNCVIIDPKVPFVPNKTALMFSRITSAQKENNILSAFSNALLRADILQLQTLCYNFVTIDLMPEYEKAFELQSSLVNKFGIQPVFTGAGPFLVYPFVGTLPIEVKQFCHEQGASLSVVQILQ